MSRIKLPATNTTPPPTSQGVLGTPGASHKSVDDINAPIARKPVANAKSPQLRQPPVFELDDTSYHYISLSTPEAPLQRSKAFRYVEPDRIRKFPGGFAGELFEGRSRDAEAKTFQDTPTLGMFDRPFSGDKAPTTDDASSSVYSASIDSDLDIARQPSQSSRSSLSESHFERQAAEIELRMTSADPNGPPTPTRSVHGSETSEFPDTSSGPSSTSSRSTSTLSIPRKPVTGQ